LVCTYGTASAQKVLIRGVQTSATVCPANTTATDGPFHYVTLDPTTGVPNAAVGTVTTTSTPAIGQIAYVTLNLYTRNVTGPKAPACSPLTSYIELRNKT
jgi:hypothetical protein